MYETAEEAAAHAAAIIAAAAKTGKPFTMLAVVEGLETSDGRLIELGTTTWREPPFALMVQDTSTHGPDQTPAPSWVGGQIEDVWRDPEDASRIFARGHFLPNEDGDRAELLMKNGMRGVSIDASLSSPAPPRVQPTAVDQDGDLLDVLVRYSDMVITNVTMVPTPAFECCCIWGDDEDVPERVMNAHGTVVPTDTEPEVVVTPPSPYEQLVASGGGPVNPPRSWFFTPEPDGYQPLEVTADGHITGHIARAGQCHIGHADRCTTAPMSTSIPPYKAFHRTVARCDDGSEVACGWLVMDTKHDWDLHADAQATADHYDHTGTLVAKIRASNGRHGVWVSGALLPGLGDRELAVLQAPEVSGDWRAWSDPDTGQRHGLELQAVLAVPFPGFPGTRTRPELLVASGEVVAMAGQFVPERECVECEEGAPMTPEERAEMDALRARVEQLEALVATASAVDEGDGVAGDPGDPGDTDAGDGARDTEPAAATVAEPTISEFAAFQIRYDADERHAMAQDGRALLDGSWAIGTVDDLAFAIRCIGHAAVKPEVLRRHLIRQAARLERPDLIPADWHPDGSLIAAADLEALDADAATADASAA